MKKPLILFSFSLFLMMAACAASAADPNTRAHSDSTLTTETRGIWVDKETLFAPKEKILEFLDAIKAAGFNSLYINTQFRGQVIYPNSAFLPQAPEANRTDILQWLLPAIHKRGLRAEAWTEYGFYAYHTPDAGTTTTRGAILDKYRELTAIDSEGNRYLHHDQWGDFYVLCPANPKSQELLLKIFEETLTRYDFDGINLDRIRFARKNYCFCNYCKYNFRQDTGFGLEDADLQYEFKESYLNEDAPALNDNSKVKATVAFYDWRKKQLNDFMNRLSQRLRTIRKGLAITSAVAAPEQINDYGQDWPTWLRNGYLDAAMPMLYAKDISKPIAQVQSITRPDDLIFFGLDAAGNSTDVLLEQINQVRDVNADGITIWYSGSVQDDLGALQQQAFKHQAKSHFALLFAK